MSFLSCEKRPSIYWEYKRHGIQEWDFVHYYSYFTSVHEFHLRTNILEKRLLG